MEFSEIDKILEDAEQRSERISVKNSLIGDANWCCAWAVAGQIIREIRSDIKKLFEMERATVKSETTNAVDPTKPMRVPNGPAVKFDGKSGFIVSINDENNDQFARIGRTYFVDKVDGLMYRITMEPTGQVENVAPNPVRPYKAFPMERLGTAIITPDNRTALVESVTQGGGVECNSRTIILHAGYFSQCHWVADGAACGDVEE